MGKTTKLVNTITDILEEYKANDIVTIDLRKIENSFCNFFVICHGTSNTHIASLADAVEDKVLERTGEKFLHTEGKERSQWVVIDYGDTVVHIFQKEQRDFYQLEDFWGDGVKKQITETVIHE